MENAIRQGELHETDDAKIVRRYNEADIAGCFAHTRQCNLRVKARPGEGCDCELGRLTEAIRSAMPKEEKKEAAEKAAAHVTTTAPVEKPPMVPTILKHQELKVKKKSS